MISHLKLINHKGIKAIKLDNLNSINVICGKNNSGKTSLAEAINKKESRVFGITMSQEKVIELEAKFKLAAQNYSMPSPNQTISWFRGRASELLNKTIYADELSVIQAKWGSEFSASLSYNSDIFNYGNMLQELITVESKVFDPMYVSPKRILTTISPVRNLNEQVGENAKILNKLFVLGTQDNKTNESKLIAYFHEVFKEISDGYDFHISIDEQNIVIKFLNKQGDWILADASGLGLSDLLIILYYVVCLNYTALVIEEPENHLHPDMQRRLLRFLSRVKDRQIFLTTHSNIFLDSTYINKVFYVEFVNGEVRCSDATSRTSILTNLGYSAVDNLVSDFIIFTEGVLDIPVIKEICNKLGFLHQFSIKFYPLCGDIMHYLDLSLFTEKGKVFAIIDSDPSSVNVRDAFIDKCRENNIPVTRLNRYSIENYFSIRAIKKVYPNLSIPDNLLELNHDEKVKKQIGSNVKSKSREIAQEMTLQEFEKTDLLDFCEEIHRALIARGK